LREVAADLREGRQQSARKRVSEILAQLEPSERSSGSSRGSSASGGGGERAGGSGARARARRALEEMVRGESDPKQGQGSSSRASGTEEKASRSPSGGGLRGPTPAASGQKDSSSSGSRADTGGAGPEKPGGSGEGRSEEGRRPEGPRSGEQKTADLRGETQLAGSRPTSESESPARELEGGAGSGWTLVGGRYVRVRIPQDASPSETERVGGPGEVKIGTPYGNAPAPSEGPPGEAREQQPIPLEYREILLGATAGKGR
jgi:hypothetical protein